jgi:hypothetical protein
LTVRSIFRVCLTQGFPPHNRRVQAAVFDGNGHEFAPREFVLLLHGQVGEFGEQPCDIRRQELQAIIGLAGAKPKGRIAA